MNRTGRHLTGVAALSLAAAATMLTGAASASADDACIECPSRPAIALGRVLDKLDLISQRSDLLADKMEPVMGKVETLLLKW